ncbi:iron chelate uptake ABC transporter family permease subunit [Klebsiella variicola subsp. variicola]|nr:iron chelate uptake ABC transporter family permease subunit [Klebsiella variicola subsp. variicola]
MQTLTRNPLADPGLLGSTPAPASPSSSARRCSGSPPAGATALLAFCGALCASLLVAFTGSQGGGQLGPVRLTLAGVALAAVLEGLSNGIALPQPGTSLRSAALQAGFAGYPQPCRR